MKGAAAASTLVGAISLAASVEAVWPRLVARDVYTNYPYTGPTVPIGDWVDPTINGDGTGFTRLVEPPAVQPSSANPTNNVNVIALSYVPGGVNIHYQVRSDKGGRGLSAAYSFFRHLLAWVPLRLSSTVLHLQA